MTVFSDTNNDAPVTVDQLVGEGKKYATVDDLAKAYLNADTFIVRLKNEQQELRDELSEKLTLEETLRRVQPVSPPVTQTKADPPVQEEQVDLAARIREELSRERKENIALENVAIVANKLIETYGDENKANEIVKAKARELGVSVEFLQDVAAKSPKAFFTQLGLTVSSPNQATATRSDVNTAALANTSQGPREGTYGYYETIRKSDPKTYFSAPIQNKMFNDAKRLGEAFYA